MAITDSSQTFDQVPPPRTDVPVGDPAAGTPERSPGAERRARSLRATTLTARARRVAADYRDRAIAPSIISGLAALLEFSFLVIAGVAIHASMIGDVSLIELGYLGPALGAPMLAVLAIHAADGYSVAAFRRGHRRLGRALALWTSVVGGFLAAMFVVGVGENIERGWLGLWFVGGLLAIIAATITMTVAVKRWTALGRLQQRAVIVGGGAAAEELIKAIDAGGNNEIRVLGIFDDRADDRSPENIGGYPKLGNIDQLVVFARLAAVDLLIVAIPITAEHRLLQLLKSLWILPVDIRLSAHASRLKLRPRSYSFVGSVPFLDIFDKPIAGWDSVVKRAFDILFASIAIVMLSPLMVGAALAVRLESRGPVIFRQKRYGFNNEVIEVMKFRSMFHEMADPAAAKVVTRGDPRVTRVGRFIRRTSIDELPQLFNVLRGELSLVGPRPHAVNARTEQQLWDEVVDGYFARHKVKPGVTGWAQVNGLRGEIDRREKIEARVQYDLHYIDNWSVLFDLYILFLTPIRVLNQENAY
ncbi:undecaprenyl-phosphate glucose phosphotransferase [Methylobrevis albus]|uniref:Undecaprenyl-phosphate glucose phosphotransferase n=1 Tax=Methylobrevis albus TaxID=2793297 RepID=A0A931I1D1_9HYPH|nr:undecaprenyl-phosphate glucose phosphotransferase [Methylobrevis albus]MBH0237148.1 undecaprenyl-phosphate glucose phosphotransferase [Methylobrevis albus]